MEEIIKALRNGLRAESLEVSFPYLEPFNLLVDYESELEYSSSGSHRDPQRRLVPHDSRKKLLTQLPKNPTEFEKELRNLVLKLYSAGESDTEDIAEELTDHANLPVVRATSSKLTKNSKQSNIRNKHLTDSNSSVIWRAGAKDGSALPTVAFVSPQLNEVCKTGSILQPRRGLKDSHLDEAGLTTKEKTSNPTLPEEESIDSIDLVVDHSILRGKIDEFDLDLDDSIQIDRKGKFELTAECQSNSEDSKNVTEAVVQTSSDLVRKNKIQSNCTEGTEPKEDSETYSYSLYSRSAQTCKPEDCVFDVQQLEFLGDKESSVGEDSKGCETLLDSCSIIPSPPLETVTERVVPTVLDGPETDVYTTSVSESNAESLEHLASSASAGKLLSHTPFISDLDHIRNKHSDTQQNNVPSCVIIDNCNSSVKLKDGDSITTSLPLVNVELPVEPKERVQVETFPSTPPNTMEGDASNPRLQSLPTQAPALQDVYRACSPQDVIRSPEKATERQLRSENTQGDAEQHQAKLWATRVSVSKDTTWPGGARKLHFQEGEQQLPRCGSDSSTGRTLSPSDFPLTPVFDDSGIRLEFSMIDTCTGHNEVNIEEQQQQLLSPVDATNGDAIHERSEAWFQSGETKKERPEYGSNSNSYAESAQSSNTFTHTTIQRDNSIVQGNNSADKEDSSTANEINSVQTDAVTDMKQPLTISSNKELSPLYFSTPKSSRNTEHISGMLYRQETDQSKQLVYQKANLEGKLEALQKEYSNVLDERKILQTKLQTVEGRLKCKLERSSKDTEKDSKTSEDAVIELEKIRSALEIQVMELLQTHHDKEAHLTELQEKLTFSKQLCQKLQEKVSNFEHELTNKEQVMTALRLEMEDIRRNLEAEQKQNEKLNKQQRQLTSDVSSLISAKEYLQKQLSAAQDARLKLQLELSDQENTVANQNKLIEQIKCEKARTSRQLMETQQKAMEGKTEILQNLEKVEEEMLQREAMMKQLEVDKEKTEKLLAVEVTRLQKENKKLQQLSRSSIRLENDLTALKTDIEEKEARLQDVERERELLSEHLKEAQQVNANDKCQMISLKTQHLELKKNLEVVNTSLKSKEDYIGTLVKEKEELERNLRIANEEKIAFDNAVQALKVDLGKVDRRFKLMQRELIDKKSELEKVQGLKESFIRDIDGLKSDLDKQESISNELRDELQQKDEKNVRMLSEKRNLEGEIVSFKDKIASLENEIKEMYSKKGTLQKQLSSTRRNLSGLEDKLQNSLKEKARLEGLLETTHTNAEEELHVLTMQNKSLKQEIVSIQHNSQKEISLCKAREATLERQLEEHEAELSDKLDKHNFEFKCVNEELQQVKESKEETERELQQLHKVTELSVRELKKKYEGQCSQVRTELDSLLEERNRLVQEHEEFKEQSLIRQERQVEYCSSIEQELNATKEALNQNKHEIEQMHLMAIELEREKGRLAGVMASQKTLRQHSVKLEETIAQREAEIAELTAELERQHKEKDMQEIAQKKRTSILESNLKSQRDNSQHLQSSLNMEKRENAKLRMQLQEKSNEFDQLQKELKAAMREVKDLEEMYNRARAEAKLHQNKLEVVVQELDQSRQMCEMLQKELAEFTEQKRMKDEHISSLDWETNQRSREVEYLKDQMRISEERQQMEIENMKTAVQVARTEATSLRSELADARKSKSSYQNEVFKLKDRLLASRQETDLIKDELFRKCQEYKNLKDAVTSGADLSEIREELISKGTEDSYEDQIDGKIKELKSATTMSNGVSQSSSTGLGLCMQTLRSQIASLQKQMNEHTDYIQIATSSWRSFQENVKKLQEVKCAHPTREMDVMAAEKDTARD